MVTRYIWAGATHCHIKRRCSLPATPVEHGARIGPDTNSTTRGTHSRENAAVRQSHADQAKKYHDIIRERALAGVCSPGCVFSCPSTLNRNEMFQCFEYSYGTLAWLSDAALNVIAPAAHLPLRLQLTRCACTVVSHRRTRSASRTWPMAKTTLAFCGPNHQCLIPTCPTAE